MENMVLDELEPYYKQYVDWCRSNGLYPDGLGKDFMIWLDDQDIQIGQNE